MCNYVFAMAMILTGLAGTAFAAAPPPADPLAEWRPLYTREPNTGLASVDQQTRREGRPSIRVEYRGEKDWALFQGKRFDVRPGEMLELSAWVRVQGTGVLQLGVITYDKQDKVIEWVYGARESRATRDWRYLRTRIIVPPGVARVEPRFTGYGPATVWVDSYQFKSGGNVSKLRNADLPASLSIQNKSISATFDTRRAVISVLDRRTQQSWAQHPSEADTIVRDAKVSPAGDAIEATLLHVPSDLDVKVAMRLEPDAPELSLSLAAQGELPGVVAWPYPFTSNKGTYLVVPMNEGISYPVDDAGIEPMRLIAYGGHGICMAFWGVTDGQKGHMAIIESADDASIDIRRADQNLLSIRPIWEGQKGRFGYERKLRYVFFDQGGHVAMCKRYRAYAQQAGLLKTFTQKRQENSNIDLLIGAANVWFWDNDPLGMVKELQAAGVQRILWSNQADPKVIAAMNQLPGVLTSRYDIYQDLMDPAMFPRLQYTHPDWTTEGWPKDIMRGPDGDWLKGWEIETKDGKMQPCGVLCDKQAPAYADKRIGAELKTHPYRCRFIDTTTASPWRECYDPKHPVTRTESRKYKMELLGLVSQKYKLVTGCETGHDASVPYCDYFEGMLSLGPYRVPDAGRAMQKIYDQVPPDVAKFQVGWKYRLPLWELVYHDCVVAQWYWGDYNNKLPGIWDLRDQFNALYGTPPMFMFSRDFWQKNKARFVRSYQATAPIARATGYSEMTDHRFLTPDRSVQQTHFANGVTVTVNFGQTPHRLPDGTQIPPGGIHTTGMPKE